MRSQADDGVGGRVLGRQRDFQCHRGFPEKLEADLHRLGGRLGKRSHHRIGVTGKAAALGAALPERRARPADI